MGIIDDPIKNDQEAFNDRVLDEQWSWYTDTFLSRIEEGGMQIIVMTRCQEYPSLLVPELFRRCRS